MERYIKISSQGVIDTKAFTLIGASTKREDKTKIGFFGSGLKYAIAYLLRNNIEFKVFSDFSELTFSKVPDNFRGQDFDVICVNGEKTSMTTEMGIDWKAWFIIREIYCNALDEGDSDIRTGSTEKNEIGPIQDKTVFYIDADHFKELTENWSGYFSKYLNAPIEEENEIKYFPGSSDLIIFRKGVRVHYEKKASIFHYDCPDSIASINESRVLSSEWSFKWALEVALQKSKSKTVITSILALVNDAWESNLDWDKTVYSTMWLECINGRVLVPNESSGFWHEITKKDPSMYICLPSKMCTSIKKTFANKVRVIGEESGSSEVQFRVTKVDSRTEFMLFTAKEFLKKAGYAKEYPIEIGVFSNTMVMGEADITKQRILLSESLFHKGNKYLVATLIEETEHLNSGFSDMTREFQSHLIERMVSVMEDNTKTYL